MAKKDTTGGGNARVLVDCHLGKINDVVSLGEDELKSALAAGLIDNDDAAVKFAEALKPAENSEQA